MVLILGNYPDISTRLGGILSARHGFRGTSLDRLKFDDHSQFSELSVMFLDFIFSFLTIKFLSNFQQKDT